jgi:hypothetical protein
MPPLLASSTKPLASFSPANATPRGDAMLLRGHNDARASHGARRIW